MKRGEVGPPKELETGTDRVASKEKEGITRRWCASFLATRGRCARVCCLVFLIFVVSN